MVRSAVIFEVTKQTTTGKVRKPTTTGKVKKQTTRDKVGGQIKSIAVYGTNSSMDKDKNTGRGEQVTDHYLSGTVTNYREKSPLNWGDFKGESTSRNYLFNPSENFEKV